MSILQSNGFLASTLAATAKNIDHPEVTEADRYLKSFRNVETKFYDEVHPQVDIGLAMSEVKLAGKKKPNIFTIHGCRHILDLIKSLDKFAKSIEDGPLPHLTSLEIYILLCAAHIHDGANVSKRDGHPARCNELLEMYKALFTSASEIAQIFSVASVHGGKDPQFGKDTFRRLDMDNSEPPRLPLLAALLRLADELSENAERVPELVAAKHDHSEESKLAFAYALSFCKFDIRKDNLKLIYNIYPKQAQLQAKIKRSKISYFDFLEGKLNAIDREARYCSQYGSPILRIAQVDVKLRLYEQEPPSHFTQSYSFSWMLNVGYPGDQENLCTRCPELAEKGITSLAQCFNSVTPKTDLLQKLGLRIP